jgi:hypothetical protein
MFKGAAADDEYERDDLAAADAPVPPHVEGYPLGGRRDARQ